MTPQQRAQQVASNPAWVNQRSLIVLVTRAIAEAVAQERERCANLICPCPRRHDIRSWAAGIAAYQRRVGEEVTR